MTLFEISQETYQCRRTIALLVNLILNINKRIVDIHNLKAWNKVIIVWIKQIIIFFWLLKVIVIRA